jgi:ABC-2 type transport system permease protein
MRSGNYFSLLSAENTKMWKRISSLIMILIMVVVSAGYCVLMKFIYTYMNNVSTESTSSGGITISTDTDDSADKDDSAALSDYSSSYTGDWKEELRQEIKFMNEGIKEAEKDDGAYMKKSQVGSMKKQVAEDQFMIDNNIKPKDTNFGISEKQSIWSNIVAIEQNTSPNFAILAALFAIIVCSAAIAGEFSQGTMKTIICRPYSRFQILSAKLLISLFYALIVLLVAIITSFVGCGIAFGFNDFGAKEMFWTGSKIIQIPAFLKMLIIFGLDYLEVAFYIAMAFLLCVVTRSRALATGISLLMLFIGAGVFQILAVFFPWGKFLPFSMTGFSSFILNGSTIYGTTLGFALVICAIYFAAFLFGGFFTFSKRDIN